MVTAPTVLIIGAGGSSPYGFPSGFGLKTEIVNGLRTPNSELFRNVLSLGFGDAQLKGFAQELSLSGGDSVDTFLEGQNDLFMRLGKIAIAAALIPHERTDFLFSRQPEINWYGYLFRQLTENLRNGAGEPLTILTFNYDRSLDHFLYTSFGRSGTLPGDKTRMITRNLRIIHLHGMLAHLPILAPADKPVRDFTPDVDRDLIAAAAQDIRVVHEAAEDDVEFVEARRLLSGATRIGVLGFGYSPENVRRILYGTWLGAWRGTLIGSARGTTGAERLKIIAQFQNKIQLDQQDHDCCRFLREQVQIIS
jgi:hypothetical protein